MRPILALILLAAVAACDENGSANAPPPHELTGDVIGAFDGMYVAEQPGPKGQVFLANKKEPLWFPSVRDTIAYLMLPEQQDEIVGIYVNDVAQLGDWDNPEPGTWVAAADAWYVVGSDRTSGLGLPEIVPFSTLPTAMDFVARHGGRTMRLADIPPSEVYDLASEADQSGGSTL
ncbi:MAG: copper resistance protein CopZ [bacterium]|nr:copper resistance protein CopZ [bacterium]